MASKKEQRRAGRKQRKEDNQRKREEKKAKKRAEKERRQDRNDARRAARREQKYQHSARKARTDRITIRQEERTKRVEARQHAKEVKFESKSEADQAAYNNGIDPNKWKADAIGSGMGAISDLGTAAIETFGGRKKGRQDPYDDSDNEIVPAYQEPGSKKRNSLTAIIVGTISGVLLIIATAMMIKGSKRKRR